MVADNRHVFGARITLRPLGAGGPGRPSLSINANYTQHRIDNPISTFPFATAEIEAAFPGRFVRGPDGRLLQIDTRPVNFARSERSELRWGFNFQKPFLPPPGARGAGGRPGAAGLPGGRGRAGRAAPGRAAPVPADLRRAAGRAVPAAAAVAAAGAGAGAALAAGRAMAASRSRSSIPGDSPTRC